MLFAATTPWLSLNGRNYVFFMCEPGMHDSARLSTTSPTWFVFPCFLAPSRNWTLNISCRLCLNAKWVCCRRVFEELFHITHVRLRFAWRASGRKAVKIKLAEKSRNNGWTKSVTGKKHYVCKIIMKPNIRFMHYSKAARYRDPNEGAQSWTATAL